MMDGISLDASSKVKIGSFSVMILTTGKPPRSTLKRVERIYNTNNAAMFNVSASSACRLVEACELGSNRGSRPH